MSEASVVSEALGPIAMSRKRTRTGSERRTIRAAERGSSDAVEQLVRRYWPDAYTTALAMLGNRSEAEDVAQDAIIAALDALDRFDRRRPFAPWLPRIVANRALDRLRAQSRRARGAIG